MDTWISRRYQNLLKNNVLKDAIRQKRCMLSVRLISSLLREIKKKKKPDSHVDMKSSHV